MLTDGQLVKEDMRRWAHHPEAAAELVDVGWWEDHRQHYQIVHHLGYQRTREQVAKQSIANRNNRAKGKTRPVRPKGESSDHSSVSEELSDGSSDERDRTGQDRPVLEGVAEKNGSDAYTPSAEQLRRIDANVRAGYDS